MHNNILRKIIDSREWLETEATRLVWLTLLAGMDEKGTARFDCVNNVAHRARVSVEETKEALRVLEGDDGQPVRSIERTSTGWRIIAPDQYLNPMRWEAEQEKNRVRVARHRAELAAERAELPFRSLRFNDAWCLWEQHRKQKGNAITTNARKLQLAKLQKMGEARAIAALEHSTECGYTGIFEPKGNSKGTPATQAELNTLEKLMGERGVHYGAFREELQRLMFSRPGISHAELHRHFGDRYPEQL
jgi:hypothetical protein